jgi:hypothetical protein
MEWINLVWLILFDAFIIATITERMIQAFKALIPEDYVAKIRKEWWQVISIITSIIIAFLLKDSIGQYWVIVGFTASLGSNVIHDILGIINGLKKDLEDSIKQVKPIEINGRK